MTTRKKPRAAKEGGDLARIADALERIASCLEENFGSLVEAMYAPEHWPHGERSGREIGIATVLEQKR